MFRIKEEYCTTRKADWAGLQETKKTENSKYFKYLTTG